MWIFGDNIEQKFGRIKYLGIYLAWGIGAGLVHIFGDTASITPAVGASGAISGVLGAYLVMFPRARIQTFLMLGFFWRMMHIRAMWFLPFWLVFQNLLPLFVGGCRIRSRRRRSSISCAHWRVCPRAGKRLYLQKDAQL